MKWCEASQQWFMYMKDRFIMKFPDCDNMHRIFKGLDKNESKDYDIKVKPL